MYIRNKEISYKKIGNNYYLIARNNPFAYVLNETGSLIWKQLRTPKSADDLVRALVSEYDVSEKTAYKDVSVFIKQFLKQKFINQISDDAMPQKNPLQKNK